MAYYTKTDHWDPPLLQKLQIVQEVGWDRRTSGASPSAARRGCPKTGTVTMDIAKAVSEVKAGKIDFKVDKTGIVHAAIGKVSFSADKIEGNAQELLSTLMKLKPTAAKGVYMKSIFMSSTMSPSIAVDSKAVS